MAQRDTQHRRLTAECLASVLDSWQKVVVAMTAVVLAAGGLVAAGLKVADSVTTSAGPVTTPPQPTPLQHSGPPTPAPTDTKPSFLGTNSFAIPDEGYLPYTAAAGQQDAFQYFSHTYANPTDLIATVGTNFAILDPPAPTRNAAYADCEAASALITELDVESLSVGSTFCVFTPDHEVMWIQLGPADPNSQSTALNVTVSDWQKPTQ